MNGNPPEEGTTTETPGALTPEPPPEAAAPAPQAPAPPPAPPISLGAAFVGVFFSPKETFARLVERPWWTAFVPIVVLAFAAGVSLWLYFGRVDTEQFMRDQIRQSPFASQMSAEQLDKAVEDAIKRPKWISPVMGVVGSMVFYVILAAVLWLVFLAMGNKPTFGGSLIATSWAFVPTLLATVVFLVLIFIKNPNDIDIQNPILTNVAAFLDRETVAKPLYALLKAVDVFNIWVVSLLGVGMASASKSKASTGVTIVAVLYILVSLIKVAFAAIF